MRAKPSLIGPSACYDTDRAHGSTSKPPLMQSPHRTSLSRSHSLVASPKRKGWCFTSTALLDTTRTEADFLEHVQAMVASNPETIRWHIVCDQLNTHQSETLVRWVAGLSGVEATWGSKARAAS